MPRMKSREITGARIWPELADAMNAFMAEHGRMSPGNLLRLAVPGLTPRPPSLAKLRQTTIPGDHLDPRVTEEEREVIREQADALDMRLLEFVTLCICRLVGTPYLTKPERQFAANERNRARVEAQRAPLIEQTPAAADVNCDRDAAAKAAPRRRLTCSPLPDTDSRWPTGMAGVDDLRAEQALRRAALDAYPGRWAAGRTRQDDAA